jgi:hypothetical protein
MFDDNQVLSNRNRKYDREYILENQYTQIINENIKRNKDEEKELNEINKNNKNEECFDILAIILCFFCEIGDS